MIRLRNILARLRLIHPYLLTAIFLVAYLLVYLVVKIWIYPPLHNTVSYSDNNTQVFGLGIPSKLDFCGEPIPTNNMAIKRDLEREFFTNGYWRSNSKMLFSKANRWFPVIEPILRQEGVPDDFKYLAVIESHLSNVTSPAGAAGFWQLVPSSAYGYGLEVNDLIDERYHVEKATRAACTHIKDAYAIFHNWTLAAAAYNRGINGIKNALVCQKTDNYYDLLLNEETGTFVYRILAYKTVLSNPSHFGIKNKKKSQNKIQWAVYKIDTSVQHLSSLAKRIGCSVTLLKQFNPWILGNSLVNPARKRYEIKVPKKLKGDYLAYVQDLTPEGRSADESFLTNTSESLVVTDSIKPTIKPLQFVVKVDEPLKKLAEFFSLKLEDVCRWNNLKETDMAVKGQTLTLYLTSH